MKTNTSLPNASVRWWTRRRPAGGWRFALPVEIHAFVVIAAAIAILPTVAVSAPKKVNGDAPVRFAVLSDLHFYDTKLGTEGNDFDNYLARDCKMLHLAEPILEAALNGVRDEQVQFVIITGDLTKDGEVLNHVRVTQYLEKLRQAGLPVFVVPGNHDMNNRDAVEYTATGTRPVPTANAAVFRAMYERFGYGQAIDTAPDSLSYLAEPVPGLWLLALDSAKWAESASVGEPVVSGRLSAATMQWALVKIAQAAPAGKKVIAFMHHGVNPHFIGEPVVFPGYLVDDWPMVAGQFAAAGLKVVFTGHNHGHDASSFTLDAGNPVPTTLCDIETGSLVSYPCAYRIAELDNAGVLHVSSRHVTGINADLGGVSFPAYAENFARAMLPYPVVAELQLMFGLPLPQAQAIAPLVVDAIVAYYAGDENPSPATQATLAYLLSQPEPQYSLGLLLYTLWYDLPLPDNTLNVSVQ